MYFCVSGAAVSHLDGQGGGEQPGSAGRRSHAPAGGSGGHALPPEVLHSSAAIVLAEPAPTRLHAGVVISTAPLMGGEPFMDPNMGRWLHVHVRPSVRGLMRQLRQAATKKGGLLHALKDLSDGHWVLQVGGQ